jgi:glycosyltransferase involved in cell wall biosynthesis
MLICDPRSFPSPLAQPQSDPAAAGLTISVVIPLFNGARFIVEALDSVFSQTLKPREVIVVDDGSTDGGPDIVARYAEMADIILFHKQNGGQSSARNLGMKHATGDLIALLDQDDAWYPTHLSELVKPFFESRPRPLGWAYSNMDEVDADGEVVAHSVLANTSCGHPKTSLVECLRQDLFILPSATLISRQAVNAVGGFDERLSGYEDDDLFVRLFRAGYDNAYIDQPLSRWRVFGASASFTRRMSLSRMTFARKLVEAYSEKKISDRYYARDLIVPRFLCEVGETLRRSLRSGDLAWADACLDQIAELEGMLPEQQRHHLGFGFHSRSPVISVVIPLYNGEDFIEEALRSVIAQTLPADEIIVVDDGSTDHGAEKVKRFATDHQIRLIQRPNAGQSAARNIGVDHAHGDLIAFLDQDDIWYPNHLAELVKPFREKREIPFGWSYSDLDEVGEKGELISRGFLSTMNISHPKRDLVTCLGHDMFILPSASLVSRKAFQSVGGFDERLSGYEDDDLFLRLFQAGFDSDYIARPLSKWRMHPSRCSYSERMAISRETYARTLISRFPNDPESARYYVRDMIAPRFFRQMSSEMRKAVLKGTREQRKFALANLAFISGHLRFGLRFPIQLILLPALRIRPVARFIMEHRRTFAGIARRFL